MSTVEELAGKVERLKIERRQIVKDFQAEIARLTDLLRGMLERDESHAKGMQALAKIEGNLRSKLASAKQEQSAAVAAALSVLEGQFQEYDAYERGAIIERIRSLIPASGKVALLRERLEEAEWHRDSSLEAADFDAYFDECGNRINDIKRQLAEAEKETKG